MSSLYYLSARSQADMRLAHEKGLGFIEHKLERKGDRGNTKYWGEFHVCYGAKLLYFMSNATPRTCRQFLELSNIEKAQIFEKCCKALVSGLTYNFDDEVWICPDCENCEDKFFKKCECGTKFYFSEHTLMKSLSTLKYKSDLTLSEIDAIDINYMVDMLADEETKEEPFEKDEQVAPVNSISMIVREENAREVKEPVFSLVTNIVEEAWTIKIGFNPTYHWSASKRLQLLTRKEEAPLESTGFVVKADPSELPMESLEEKVGEAVQLALEVGNVIAKEKEFKLKPYKSSNLAWNRILNHKKAKQGSGGKRYRNKWIRTEGHFHGEERKLNLRQRRNGQRIVRDKRGSYRWKVKKQTQKQKRRTSSNRFYCKLDCFYSMRTGPVVSENVRSVKCATSKKSKISRKLTRLEGSRVVTHVTRALCKIAKSKSMTIELIAGRRKRVIRQKEGKSYVELKHMTGLKRRTDLEDSEEMHKLFEDVCRSLVKKFTVKEESLSKGSSGMIIKPSFGSLVGRFRGTYLIIRGRCDGRLLDARSKLTWSTVMNTEHYSDVAEKFWLGFNRAFLRHRKPSDHVCSSDMDVTMCGEVAALATLVLFPCHKITCNTCMSKVKGRVIDEVGEDLNCELERLRETLNSYSGSFGHVSTLLDQLNKVLNARNTNDEAFKEIARKIDEKKDSPWTHMSAINNVLIKGSLATGFEFERASDNLREIVRWHLKRTESIKAGSVESFRNKRSGKAHFNPALMCDNQLDRNGNFLWGERQYHAKRFFVNYFEKVDHSKGYEHYSIRKNPNGVRRIAIGNLIFSTNLERFRQQMVENHVEQGPITRECISLRNNNYVHVCSCVTLDDGTPVTSELKTPTKNHLVLGNSGDAKYVDLPTLEVDSMFIAKEGYCYMNIFLAMFVNLPEGEAKDFTKRVRDLVGAKLGQWPTMLDVERCANQLVIFHPDAASAELPRILIDHKHKVMHVMDSFGSVDSGYHILKANTVNQLIQFAREPLDSELKHYLVGGELFDPTMDCLHQLIRRIYKPNELLELLKDEPHLIVISLMSPSVLLTLFNSGAVEHALSYWIKRDQDVVETIVLVEQLSRKLPIARTILEQFNEIRQNARDVMEVMERGSRPWISYDRALTMLEMFANSHLTDEGLIQQGFSTLDPKLRVAVEKTYAALLQEEWNALSLRQRLYLRYYAYKVRPSFSRYLKPTALADLSIVYDFSPRHCVREVGKALWYPVQICKKAITHVACKSGEFARRNVIRGCQYVFKDLLQFVNVMLVLSLLLQIFKTIQGYAHEHRKLQKFNEEKEREQEFRELESLYAKLVLKTGEQPTVEEFVDYVKIKQPSLVEKAVLLTSKIVSFQAKTDNEKKLEQIIAFVTLVMMMVDTDKSDCLYRILNKFKGIMSSDATNVYHQSLDDITDLFEDKQLTVDFDLSTDEQINRGPIDVTFEKWWDNQLSSNHVTNHYRIGGHFLEFSRSNAATVASEIAHSAEREFLIRGAVGSGKSTNLPYLLSGHGNVLLVEPTRPLCENVCKQLRGTPFHCNPTIRMRGLSSFGSSKITIMTSGFALHYFAHNVNQLREFDFIIFDECHVVDCQAMGLYCLMDGHNVETKLLKVSATPPGREVEFSTQFPVKIVTEESISFQQLVANFGTGANSDVTVNADNILVYVSSYNEVDQLSKLLNDRGYLVTKVDGRTMKVGKTEIETKGTKNKKHFIVATNIIENGVTLDIDAVIDFGMKVVAEMDSDSRVIRYSKRNISYGERIQRLGRVGRHKDGVALRIGHTEKGIQEIPEMVATEAAFLSFAYGLPVMTHNVGLSILKKCTVRQARTMLQYELSPFFTQCLVNFDGTVHPKINEILRPYKLRDSEIKLSESAIPHGVRSIWLSVQDYDSVGVRFFPKGRMYRIPFYVRDVPERFYEQIWQAVEIYKRDHTFGRISSASAGKIAYTLRTDIHAIPRTLLTNRNKYNRKWKCQTRSLQSDDKLHWHGFEFFTPLVEYNNIQSRYLVDHSVENIRKLHMAKSSKFSNRVQIGNDCNVLEMVQSLGAVRSVFHQNVDGVAHIKRELGLRGVWDKTLMVRDALICGFTLGGWAMLIYQFLKEQFASRHVYHQGFSKQKTEASIFVRSHAKLGKEVYGDDGTIEHYFGEAYTKRGNKKGKMHGLGSKTRKFVATYGFKPEDYSYVRYLDPLTGETLDESPNTDVSLAQEHFDEVRLPLRKKMRTSESDNESLAMGESKLSMCAMLQRQLLRSDLTPHNPLKVCDNKLTIAGFPDSEFELRQTGPAKQIDATNVPSPSKAVLHEGKSLCNGMRNYNGIASVVCHLQNTSGSGRSLYGVGYNSYIITNRHLFRENNGTLIVKTQHGQFVVQNTCTLKVAPIGKTDIAVIRMPKDFPPFHSRAKFRHMASTDKVCMVGVDYQENHVASKVSETSSISAGEGDFGSHWISTNDGDCGCPLVCVSDGYIVGLHSLSSSDCSQNYFAKIPENFEEQVLRRLDKLEWSNHWRYNPNSLSWGGFKGLGESTRSDFIMPRKKIQHLNTFEQSGKKWLLNQLHGNLKGVAEAPSNLVTKHIVKGPCMLFQQYLNCNEEAKQFFTPLMGHYMKSVLNKEAYAKDLLKYSSDIIVGEVEHSIFIEESVQQVIELLEMTMSAQIWNTLQMVTIVIQSMNMDAAVGALYAGKKRKYFENSTADERRALVKASCRRLYEGRMGIWNGSLKAEVRPAEKVLASKTRTFTAAPIDTLLGAKVCVDDFNNWFYSKNMVCPWTVGMTKFYKGWDEFLRKFPDGWIYCDADGSQFDSSLTPYLLNAVLEVRLWAMEPWDIGEQMLRNLYGEITYTPILTPDGTIVKKFKGNNSGQPSTVVDNTLMVLITMYYALRKAGYDREQQEQVCVFYINGDDLCIAVHPEHESLLDTLSSSFAELGLKYDFSSRHRDKQELWFMSHRGILIENMYIPKLEPERIVAILEWDKSKLPEHRLEAIMAAIIESWGYEELTRQSESLSIGFRYKLPYNELAKQGQAPYVSELGLRRFTLSARGHARSIEVLSSINIFEDESGDTPELVAYHESTTPVRQTIDLIARQEPCFYQSKDGAVRTLVLMPNKKKRKKKKRKKEKEKRKKRKKKKRNWKTNLRYLNRIKTQEQKGREIEMLMLERWGVLLLPRIKTFTDKMVLPKFKGKTVLNLDHLLQYNPQQINISNTRATQSQFDKWYEGVRSDYGLNDKEMEVMFNGLMVWCIENGTSPDVSGVWVMIDDDGTQVDYPIRPLIEHATPTFRQIMAHFSNAAEAYIARRRCNGKTTCLRYRIKVEHITDEAARYAFDFYEKNSRTPARAREAHMQKKAAALRNANRRLFGIDGSVSNREENTERHTVEDVDRDMHSLLGMRK
uniref:Genome polyprotein n=2 Tax=Zucchini tigre mosaic virus TaxID=1406816 RepID=A0A2H4R0J0_9POTV|nr:polyprotein [Zucchini tigre mosaic virus]